MMAYPWLAVPLVGVGGIVSLIIIGGGLAWLLVRGIKGREVDRRVIFIFILLAVAAPLLFPITFEEKATPVVQRLFDRIENLPPGSRILLSFDFDPAMAPEVQPMADAITRHAMTKDLRVIFMSLWATGQGMMTQTLVDVVEEGFPEKEPLVDYVNLGYKAGNEGVLNVIVTDLKKMFPTNVDNVPYSEIPVLHGIKSVQDVELVVSIGGGKPGVKEWVLFVGDPGNVPVAGGVAAVVAPQMYPYYPKQLIGILGGVKGAAEYESELVRVHPELSDIDTRGLEMMGPQTLAHMVIITFILIGNFTFFMSRRRSRRREV